MASGMTDGQAMTRGTRSASGTVATLQPRPGPVEEADRLVREGVPRSEAASRLAEAWSEQELRAAQLWWVRRMPKRHWDDHHPSAVLRLLEAALAIAAPLLPDDSAR